MSNLPSNPRSTIPDIHCSKYSRTSSVSGADQRVNRHWRRVLSHRAVAHALRKHYWHCTIPQARTVSVSHPRPLVERFLNAWLVGSSKGGANCSLAPTVLLALIKLSHLWVNPEEARLWHFLFDVLRIFVTLNSIRPYVYFTMWSTLVICSMYFHSLKNKAAFIPECVMLYATSSVNSSSIKSVLTCSTR